MFVRTLLIHAPYTLRVSKVYELRAKHGWAAGQLVDHLEVVVLGPDHELVGGGRGGDDRVEQIHPPAGGSERGDDRRQLARHALVVAEGEESLCRPEGGGPALTRRVVAGEQAPNAQLCERRGGDQHVPVRLRRARATALAGDEDAGVREGVSHVRRRP